MKGNGARRRALLSRGFTLLEILVALTILAMAFAVVYRSVGLSMTLSANSRDRLAAIAAFRSLAAQTATAADLTQWQRGELPGWRWEMAPRPVTVTWQPSPEIGGPYDSARFDPKKLPLLIALDWQLTSLENGAVFHFTTYWLGPSR